MSFNPFNEKARPIIDTVECWKELYPKAYCKEDVDPYTKTRIILMNGTEYEAVWFSHQFNRHCDNNDIRRELALARRIEQQQQKKISNLKPINESVLETTIAYEQLAVDLTCRLAKMTKEENIKKALDFALLEDFDHLYRYSDLLDLEHGIKAKHLVGSYTELTPGRPTIAHHRHPYDSIKFSLTKNSSVLDKLISNIITAAEQQTMNYYMNQSQFYTSELGRRLYLEIAMVEEQHVTQYGSLIEPTCTWLEGQLMHEFTECYLYYSCYMDETDKYVKQVWEQCLEQEIAHLHKAAELLKKYEKKDWCEVIPCGEFPQLLTLGPNKEYVREVLKGTVCNTAKMEGYQCINDIEDDYQFFQYQNKCIGKTKDVASHQIIETYIKEKGEDYRYEDSPNPRKELQDRKCDNTELGRVKSK